MREKDERDKVRLMNVLSRIESMTLEWLCKSMEDVEYLLREGTIEWDPSEDLYRLTDKGQSELVKGARGDQERKTMIEVVHAMEAHKKDLGWLCEKREVIERLLREGWCLSVVPHLFRLTKRG